MSCRKGAEGDFWQRDFTQQEAAEILGVSRSYMKKLDNDYGENHLERMRRNSKGQPVYSASEIIVMREMGIGQRKGKLRPLADAMKAVNVTSFGLLGRVNR